MVDTRLEDVRNSRRLLVAASDPKLVRVSVEFYERLGFDAFGAHSPSEVVEAVRLQTPQVVLLSTEIGDRNAAKVIGDIKAINADCNILLFAREDDSETIRNAWRSGAFFLVRQGATPRQIVPEVERAFQDYVSRVEFRYWRRFVFVLMPFAKEF